MVQWAKFWKILQLLNVPMIYCTIYLESFFLKSMEVFFEKKSKLISASVTNSNWNILDCFDEMGDET